MLPWSWHDVVIMLSELSEYFQAPGTVLGQSQIDIQILKGKDLDRHCNQTGHHNPTPPTPLNFSKVET